MYIRSRVSGYLGCLACEGQLLRTVQQTSFEDVYLRGTACNLVTCKRYERLPRFVGSEFTPLAIEMVCTIERFVVLT